VRTLELKVRTGGLKVRTLEHQNHLVSTLFSKQNKLSSNKLPQIPHNLVYLHSLPYLYTKNNACAAIIPPYFKPATTILLHAHYILYNI
jgi:hypothetical protein